MVDDAHAAAADRFPLLLFLYVLPSNPPPSSSRPQDIGSSKPPRFSFGLDGPANVPRGSFFPFSLHMAPNQSRKNIAEINDFFIYFSDKYAGTAGDFF